MGLLCTTLKVGANALFNPFDLYRKSQDSVRPVLQSKVLDKRHAHTLRLSVPCVEAEVAVVAIATALERAFDLSSGGVPPYPASTQTCACKTGGDWFGGGAGCGVAGRRSPTVEDSGSDQSTAEQPAAVS